MCNIGIEVLGTLFRTAFRPLHLANGPGVGDTNKKNDNPLERGQYTYYLLYIIFI